MLGKILIIEDDPAVRRCYERLFQRAGYSPRLEPSGAAAEKNLDHHRDARVVILDYRMPGPNGLEVLRSLRRRDFDAACLLVTAFAVPEILEEARRLGIRRVFSKPVDISKLLKEVEAILLSGGSRENGSSRPAEP